MIVGFTPYFLFCLVRNKPEEAPQQDQQGLFLMLQNQINEVSRFWILN